MCISTFIQTTCLGEQVASEIQVSTVASSQTKEDHRQKHKNNMKAQVTALYRKGKRTQGTVKPDAIVTGDLNLSTNRHPVSGLFNTEAVVLNERGISLLPDLNSASCLVIGANGLRLRGVEIVDGKEFAQEWWCVPHPFI